MSARDGLADLREADCKAAWPTACRVLAAPADRGDLHRPGSTSAVIACEGDRHPQASILSIGDACGAVDGSVAREPPDARWRIAGRSGVLPARRVTGGPWPRRGGRGAGVAACPPPAPARGRSPAGRCGGGRRAAGARRRLDRVEPGGAMTAGPAFRNLTPGHDRHPVVHHLEGQIAEGSLTAIVGPQGAGRSTLPRGVIGTLAPLGGHIALDGRGCDAIACLPRRSDIDRAFPIPVRDPMAMGLRRETVPLGRPRAHLRETLILSRELVAHRPSAEVPTAETRLRARTMAEAPDPDTGVCTRGAA
jgi:hypothetical protein